jgi:hypothetical protein
VHRQRSNTSHVDSSSSEAIKCRYRHDFVRSNFASGYCAAVHRAYERLEVQFVRATAERLRDRIGARLPGRNLVKVAAELVQLIDDVGQGAEEIRGRVRRARLLSWTAMALVLAGATALLVVAARDAFDARGPDSSVDWLPLIEAGINDVVFVAIAVFFLRSIPERIERDRVLVLLHRLRSLAHIVDMHQLSKDPERLSASYTPTPKSVEVGLDRDRMQAYLEYCTELLSLIGKTAALCAEASQDGLVLSTVSTVERLTTDLSSEVWQKIAVLPPASPV